MKKDRKQRLTSFIDSTLVKRAKVRGALEGLTLSEVVEKALESYAPMIETSSDHHIHLNFIKAPKIGTLNSGMNGRATRIVVRHSKAMVVPK